MENASKALLIAGSVLIVIALIAVGVRIFSSSEGTADSVETAMSAREIAMFNSKFESYQGNRKSGREIKELIKLVRTSNATNSDYSKIAIEYKGTGNPTGSRYYSESNSSTSSAISFYNLNNLISEDSTYRVTFYYYKKTMNTSRDPIVEGVLHTIFVNENS